MARFTLPKQLPIGQRFTRLVVREAAEPLMQPNGARVSRSLCQCDCGTLIVVRNNALKRNNTRSCGCLAKETKGKNTKTHGESGSKLYYIWQNIKSRCSNPKAKNYKYYGGRGIKVCKEWQESFETFVIDIGERPPGYSLDRINNNGNYEPGNIRWVPQEKQALNTRKNRYVEWNGELLILAEAVRRSGLPYSRVINRLNSGWSVDKALTTPLPK
jgi:hypothetical protein